MTVLTPANAFPATGGVLLDAVGTKGYTSSNTAATYTGITVGAGSNRALVVTLNFGSASPPTGLTVTWDSGGTNQAMTQIVSVSGPADSNSQLWGLIAPTSGNKTLALSWTNSNEVFIAAISFSNVDQTGGTTSFPNATSATSIENVTLTAPIGDYVVCSAVPQNSEANPLGTDIYFDDTTGGFINAAAQYAAGSGSTAIGWVSTRCNTIVATAVAFIAKTKLAFPQHLSGQTQVTSYTYPGAVWPKVTGPAVLSWTNAFPNLAFPQHLSGQTKTVQNFIYPGAVQPKAAAGPAISTIINKVFLAEVARLMGR